MVRLDKCVEALYDSVTAENRTKGLQILTVMKGAISMSRSKTGECIFRTNKSEKKNLERLIKIEGRNSDYNIAQIEAHRKQVLNRWSKVLANQVSCSSQALFEELMEISDVDEHGGKAESRDLRDERLKTLIEKRLVEIEKESKQSGITSGTIPRRRHKTFEERIAEDVKLTTHLTTKGENSDKEFVTERKEIRSKYNSKETAEESSASKTPKAPAIVLEKSSTVHLPVIRREMTGGKQTIKPEEKVQHSMFERDLTDWGNWSLKDKSWIKGYIVRERTHQEDLIIRNALNKIDTELSGSNRMKRQQFRQKLHYERMQRLAAEKKRKEKKDQEHAQKEAEVTESSAEVEITSIKVIPNAGFKIVKRVEFKEPLLLEHNDEGVKKKLCSKPGTRTSPKLMKRYQSVTKIQSMPVIPESPPIFTITPIQL